MGYICLSIGALSRACISYHDFLDRGLLLTSKLLNQEFKFLKLKIPFRKFYGRHQVLFYRYEISFHRWQRMCSLCRYYHPVPFSWIWPTEMTYYRVSTNMSNTTVAICGAGSAQPSVAHKNTTSFWWGLCCSVFFFMLCFVYYCLTVCFGFFLFRPWRCQYVFDLRAWMSLFL